MLEQLWLVHPDDEMCVAFKRRFRDLPNVQIIQGRFQDLEPHDCFVTAGNSFGIMTAGIDAAVVQRFGEPFMQSVQLQIMNQFFGEQPIGTAFVNATGDATLPFVCHAPTMRVPSSIDGTDKVYSATWAALLAIMAHNQISKQRKSLRFQPWEPVSGEFLSTKLLVRWRRPIAICSIRHIEWIGILSSNEIARSATTMGDRS
ncbi:hypothetical protein BH11PLA2_BH11PLA2_03590 [soil metagenome]